MQIQWKHKSKYNNTCPQRFMTDKRFPDSDGCDRGWPVDKGMLNWFKMLCMWLKIDSDRWFYTLQELHSKMLNGASEKSVYCVQRLKQELHERYRNKIYFTEIDGKSNVVHF